MITDLTSGPRAPLNFSMSRARSPARVSRGFPPVVGVKPRLLLLGSLPGRASIEAGEYYAQPRNTFWRIMGELCAAGPELSYTRRLAALKRAGVALWDVLHAAQRPGSLDSNIVAGSEQINPIAELLTRKRSIRLVAFNGQKAAHVFGRHVQPMLMRDDIDTVTLPSSSPAHASLSLDRKLELWLAALGPYLDTA